MELRRQILIVILIFISQRASAQVTKLVCGEPVTAMTTFSVPDVGTPDDDTSNDVAALRAVLKLRSQLDERAGKWSEDVRRKVVAAYDAMMNDDFAPADFRIDDISSTTVISRQVAFASSPFELELPRAGDEPLCAGASEKSSRMEAASFVLAFSTTMGRLNAPAFQKGAGAIARLEKQLDKYLFEGFPMFPWEAFVNGLMLDKSIVNGPPRDVLVLMHPASGIVGSVGSDTDSDIDGVLSVEPLGWIRYSQDYSSWYGVSLMAVFPTDRNAGYGVALNYNNFKLGVTWHDDDTGVHEGAAVFFGMDLYQLLSREKRNYQNYLNSVKAALGTN